MKAFLPTKLTLALSLIAIAMVGCGSGSSPASPTASILDQNAPPTLYDQYGGEPTIQKIVDEVVTAVTVDPETAPYFALVDQPGHDTTDHLKSCFDLQFIALFGGPATYPGVSHYRSAPPEGYACKDMAAIHAKLGISHAVFNQFMNDVAVVLANNGIAEDDINTLAPQFFGFKSQIVTK
jgi:truncated hemoglobin YjbI